MNCNKSVIELINKPSVLGTGAVVGKTESEGPFGNDFDYCYDNDGINQNSWENAECELLKNSMEFALENAGIDISNIDLAFAGDLLNQCTSSTYAFRNRNIPFCGLFGACSTMAYSIALAAVFINAGYKKITSASTSSHFCSAEKQFRYPLEYGNQRPPTAQRTVTGAGTFIIGEHKSARIYIPRVYFGKIWDLGVSDTSNMGAAMAPAAAESIFEYFVDTDTLPSDYDLIITGDLGKTGSDLLIDYLNLKKNIDISAVHNDCGKMIFDLNVQNVDSGGSGCGCSAVVMASVIMKRMLNKEIKKVLFVGTGALMSPLISLQGESIPSVAHIVEFNI